MPDAQIGGQILGKGPYRGAVNELGRLQDLLNGLIDLRSKPAILGLQVHHRNGGRGSGFCHGEEICCDPANIGANRRKPAGRARYFPGFCYLWPMADQVRELLSFPIHPEL